MKKFMITGAIALGMLFMAAPAAQAQTIAELQAMIDALMAQLEGGSTEGSMLSDHDGVNLEVGVTSSRVGELQACMNAAGYSTGVVDNNFGPNTAAGVMAFQASQGLVVDGIVGVATTPAFQAACSDGDVEPEGEAPEFGEIFGEEADIEDTDTSSGDEDDVAADTKGQSVAMFEIELDDQGGALRVDRVDVYFDLTTTPDENDLYDVFDAIALEVDGDEVAGADTDDEDDWRDLTNSDSTGYFRLSGLDFIIEAGDKVEFDLVVDTADLDNVDDLDLIVDVSFEIRYTDEAGITDTIDLTGAGDVIDFTIEELSVIEFDTDEENDNPEDITVSLNEDEDDVIALVNSVEVDEQGGVIEDVTVTFDFDADLNADDIDDLVNEVYLEIDGEVIESDDINDITAGGLGSQFTVTFEIDDMEVEDEDEFEFKVSLDLEEQDGGNFLGNELSITNILFEGEDQTGEDFAVNETPDSAPVLSLSGGALLLEDYDIDGYNVIGGDSQAAKVTFTVNLEADGDDDITLDGLAGTPATEGEVYAAFVFEVDGTVYFARNDGTLNLLNAGAGTVLAGYSVSIEDGSGDNLVQGDNDVVDDNSSEEFEITITVDANVAVAGTGEYEIELTDVNWVEDAGTGDIEGNLDVSLESDEIDLVKNN